jgi:hypothetical protein
MSSSNCNLSYALQMANQPLINLFIQTYSGVSGQQAWLDIPSNKVLLAQGNNNEVIARWNVITIGISTSLTPPPNGICTTNLANQLTLHDLLLLSLLPASYLPSTCPVGGTAMALSQSTKPVTTTTTSSSSVKQINLNQNTTNNGFSGTVANSSLFSSSN